MTSNVVSTHNKKQNKRDSPQSKTSQPPFTAAHSPDPACGSADIGVALSFEFERLKNWGQKLWDKVAANDEFDMNMAAYEPLLPGAAGDYGDIDYTTAVDDEHQTAAAAAVSTLRSPLQAVAAESARALNELRGAMARAHHAEQEVERLKVQLLALEQAMIEIRRRRRIQARRRTSRKTYCVRSVTISSRSEKFSRISLQSRRRRQPRSQVLSLRRRVQKMRRSKRSRSSLIASPSSTPRRSASTKPRWRLCLPARRRRLSTP